MGNANMMLICHALASQGVPRSSSRCSPFLGTEEYGEMERHGEP
jgi:hypothetical protein